MHEARRRFVQRNPRSPAYCETGRPYLRRTSGLGSTRPTLSPLPGIRIGVTTPTTSRRDAHRLAPRADPQSSLRYQWAEACDHFRRDGAGRRPKYHADLLAGGRLVFGAAGASYRLARAEGGCLSLGPPPGGMGAVMHGPPSQNQRRTPNLPLSARRRSGSAPAARTNQTCCERFGA
jgi:hypothetical protein